MPDRHTSICTKRRRITSRFPDGGKLVSGRYGEIRGTLMRLFRTGKWRHFLTSLVALQLAVASLIPQGYMLDIFGGQNTIIICTADGLVSIPDPHQPEEEETAQAPCSFSTNIQPILAGNADVVSGYRVVRSAFAPTADPDDFSSRRYSPAQPRAPPIA